MGESRYWSGLRPDRSRYASGLDAACPKVGSAELTGELAEVYAQALLRDEFARQSTF